MAMTHQKTQEDSHSEFTGFSVPNELPDETRNQHQSGVEHQPVKKGIDLTVVSLGVSMIAVQITLMIALVTPQVPMPPPLLDAAVMDQPVANAPQPVQPKLPYLHTTDKRFMNGLEVNPAPADADPFANNGTTRK